MLITILKLWFAAVVIVFASMMVLPGPKTQPVVGVVGLGVLLAAWRGLKYLARHE